MYTHSNQLSRNLNYGFVVCLLYCLACWAGVAYLVELAVG